ncbi:dihydrofolate reductase family protein [Amaricoccus sp.]|uniref:dihydrofolate reductase family protein n=1 Tax=Amaricoccus sp. TaxID=1872485 RepID=UPI001B3DE4E4|nr:dihydrofolate reductase family protein [Amaricoccus sp.]MBP7001154.1 dihydrofolate reductase [Amaricoccus sp.]
MGKLIVWNLVTLDGCFEGPEPWDLSFHALAWGDELRDLSLTFGAQAEALVFGRKTYEGMAAYWPEADEDGGIKAYMNALPKLVASRTLTDLAWSNSRATADILGEIRALKARSEKHLYIFGSADLVASLLPEGVIDEMLIGVVPVILGRGRPLFREGDRVSLTLLSAEPTRGGTVILRYALAGA